MTTKKTHALRIALALASLAAMAVVFPILAMVLLGLLTLVLPLLLVLSPLLVLLPVAGLVHLARDRREPAGATSPASAGMGAPALHAPAR
jgi:hypothetical protein